MTDPENFQRLTERLTRQPRKGPEQTSQNTWNTRKWACEMEVQNVHTNVLGVYVSSAQGSSFSVYCTLVVHMNLTLRLW